MFRFMWVFPSLALLLIISCTDTDFSLGRFFSSARKTTYVSPENAHRFIVAMDEAPKNLHPFFAFDLNSQLVDELLFESLIVLDDTQSRPICTRLCETFEFVSPTVVSIVLSQDLMAGALKFSDLSPITPEDILASLAVMTHDQNPYKGAFEIILRLELASSNRLNIYLKEAKPSFIVDLFLVKILKAPQAVLPPIPVEKLLSSGPYVWHERNHSAVSLNPNPAYTTSTAYMPLTLMFIRDEQTRVFKFIKGEVHAIFNAVPLKSVSQLATKYHAHILTTPGINITYLGINHTDPVLKDPLTRRFIYESLNIPKLIEYKLYTFGIQHFSMLPIGSPFINPEDLASQSRSKLTPQEITLAKRALKDRPLELKTSNLAYIMSLARAIKSQLSSVGITLTHHPMEFGALMDDLKSGNFQLTLAKFVGITEPSVFYDFFHSQFIPPKGRNRGRFVSAQWDKLSEALSQETHIDKQKDLVNKLQTLFAQELPVIPLWITKNVVAVDASYHLSKISPRQSLRDFMYLQKSTK